MIARFVAIGGHFYHQSLDCFAAYIPKDRKKKSYII
jgi:hypothetical protein